VTGAAIASITPAAASASGSGRRCTVRAIRANTPVPVTGRAGATRRPTSTSMAGSRVSAAATTTATTATPASPMDRRNGSGKTVRPASTAATVSPEYATVRPAVTPVRLTAASTCGCRVRSSRNRLTIRSP
jgi:hypothetical protein